MTSREIWIPYVLSCYYNNQPDIARIHIHNFLRQIETREG